MIALLFAPFIGVFFLFLFILAVKICASIYPAFGFLVFPAFVLTNIVMIIGGILRSRT